MGAVAIPHLHIPVPHATAKDEWTAIPANLGRARFGRRLSTAETSRAFGTSRKKMELQTVRFPLLSDCRSHFLHPGPRAVTGVVLRRSSLVHSVRRHIPILQILYQLVRVFWQKTICASPLEPCEPRKPLLKFMSRLYTYTYSLVYIKKEREERCEPICADAMLNVVPAPQA
jgi:hypothetical protein